MRIRIFDIRWRVERPNLPDVIEYDWVLVKTLKNNPKLIGEPLRRFIHKSYLVTPVFFKYILGNTKRVFEYDFQN